MSFSIEHSFISSMHPGQADRFVKGFLRVAHVPVSPKDLKPIVEKVVTEVPLVQPDATQIYKDVFTPAKNVLAQN